MWVCQWVDFSIEFRSTQFSDAKCLICLVINQVSQINKTQERAAVANINIDFKSGKIDVSFFFLANQSGYPMFETHMETFGYILVEPVGGLFHGQKLSLAIG